MAPLEPSGRGRRPEDSARARTGDSTRAEGTADAAAGAIRIAGIQSDSRRVRPGDLFVAIPGGRADGHEFAAEAVRRGASAIVAEREVPDAAVPVVHVADSRRALASLAAEWYGRPADRLTLVGITGSLGKTSVLMMLRAMLLEAGYRVGVIGSLSAHFADGESEPTRFTTPDPLQLHRILARMEDRGTELVMMEATSHALAQSRVHGLRFSLGVFTNLVLLEHQNYHGGFREYVAAKSRFLDLLEDGAPLVYSSGDRALRGLLDGREIERIGCGSGAHACVRADAREVDASGTRLRLRVRRTLPRVRGIGGRLSSGRAARGGGRPGRPHTPEAGQDPVAFPLELRLLGRGNVMNAVLAVAAGLCLGVPVKTARGALERFAPPRRRMQILRCGPYTLLDDTVGHPDSITAVFEVASRLPHEDLRAAYAMRGQRGAEINRRDAEALAVWAARVPLEHLIITSSADATDEANRVAPEERDAFLDGLRRHGVAFEYQERLRDMAGSIVRDAGAGDLILLLGAQGMNRGAAAVLRRAIPSQQ